jgi:hypothetical protein
MPKDVLNFRKNGAGRIYIHDKKNTEGYTFKPMKFVISGLGSKCPEYQAWAQMQYTWKNRRDAPYFFEDVNEDGIYQEDYEQVRIYKEITKKTTSI